MDSKLWGKFSKLKYALTTAPILKISNPDKDFVVCTNACKEGVGGGMSQEGHVVSYDSRKLKLHEENYPTHDLELASLMLALNLWITYLALKSDHQSLKHLFTHMGIYAR